jgi:hypothetical protein
MSKVGRARSEQVVAVPVGQSSTQTIFGLGSYLVCYRTIRVGVRVVKVEGNLVNGENGL